MENSGFQSGMAAIGGIIAILMYTLIKELVSWIRTRRNRRAQQTLIDITPQPVHKRWIAALVGWIRGV